MLDKDIYHPRRIVCLTEETTETLYHLGEQDRIVGISGFTVRPARARKEKPKVSTFLDAEIDKILALKPDLVIGFSDIQAGIAKQLIEKGITVWVNNHRSVQGILAMIAQLGALVGQYNKALELIHHIESDIERLKAIASTWKIKPKVYFEEWYDPLITGIQWVSEVVEIAGGINVFAEKGRESLAKNRILKGPEEVVLKNPDIILASWCGKMFKKENMLARERWHLINAVKNDAIYAIDSSIILQPGPASLTEGLHKLFTIFENWVVVHGK